MSAEDTFGNKTALAQDAGSAIGDSADLVYRETQLLWLVNIERDKQGVPPLRWNRELSEAARWFTRDSVDGPVFSCDHLDSNNEGLGMRMRRFGYTNPVAFGELLVCGFVEPDAAVYGWKVNPIDDYKQYKLMLDTRFREAGTAYHYSNKAGRGMVGLNLAGDLSYAPVVINLEAPTTPDPNVSLYIYPTQFPPLSIKVSNSPVFENAEWQPYTAKLDWSLLPGVGWRTVYVLTRDSNGDTTIASDSIWLGDGLPLGEVSLDQATSIGVGYAMNSLPDTEGKRVRFSLGWEYDDADDAFSVVRGTSETVRDPSAVGGTALRLRSDGRESLLHSRFDNLPANRLLTLYVRARVDAVQNAATLLTLTVKAGGFAFGPLNIHATDFASANQWQEFALDLILPAEANPAHVDLEIAHTGAQQVWLDTLRVYSQSAETAPQIIWPVGVTDLRGQAVQARFEGPDGLEEPFDIAYSEVDSFAPELGNHVAIDASPPFLTFRSMGGTVANQAQVVLACKSWCASVKWEAQVHAPWLQVIEAQEGLLVYFDPSRLTRGAYQGTIFLNPVTGQSGSAEESASDDSETGNSAWAQSNTPGKLQQTWVMVYVTVDGAEPLPPRDVLQAVWLPIAR